MSHLVTNMHTLNHKNRPSVPVDPLKLHPERAPTDGLMERMKEGGRAEGMLIKDQSEKDEEERVCV